MQREMEVKKWAGNRKLRGKTEKQKITAGIEEDTASISVTGFHLFTSLSVFCDTKTMLYLKKYFTEGLIQVAILLSLCGVMVDVGLEPYLPLSWHEMILGPTSALTQTQFHNLRNRLEVGQGLPPKNVDLDGFFTTRRLLGWVRSLDRLQIPHAELETWLVQRGPDPLPMECPDQPYLLERALAGMERDQNGLTMEPRPGLGALQEEVEVDEKEEGTPHGLHHSGALDEGGEGEEDEEEDMAPMHRHYRRTVGGGRPEGSYRELAQDEVEQTSSSLQECLRLLEANFPFPEEQQSSYVDGRTGDLEQGREPVLSRIIPTDTSSLDLELHWQDLLAIMEPEVSINTRDILKNSNVNTLRRPPNHLDLLGEDTSEDFCMEESADDNSRAFNMNLPAHDLVDNVDDSPVLQNALNSEDLTSFDINFNLHDLTPSSSAPAREGNVMTQDLLISPSSVFLVDKEDVRDEDSLPSQLIDLLDDDAILDEMRLLNLVLEEGFSPEMAAKLEEEGYIEYGDGEADSDSGLSLDFSYSPASPCASEALYSSSSSSSSSSTSSSSCMSDVESPFYEVKDEDVEEGLFGSDMEVEVSIKQEELEEEDMGAVGGGYPDDVKKLFPVNYGDHKLLNGFPIDHDHTYNQPWSPASSPSPNTKHTKSSPKHHNPRRYHYSSSRHISETKMWSRDERRSRALKIPFSNELIVNMPVEEFNDLLTNYQLSEEQLNLVRDIRRRGKNKIAAQNCRKRKLDVVLGLEDHVSGLRRHRLRLLREKQDALRNLQEMKRRMGILYQEVFSRLRDEEGRPLDSTEYFLNFGPNGSVMVASHQQEAWVPLTVEKKSKKQRSKKK
ncbi:putative nuclear factor erythroid 2-related factor 1-like [Scophthalmus maximus]|uniref:Endoplasmic reticulum membrane sensor NFE2L1 n=1 Tax=Scophthalmus maximus TaxID=52904 RepID=A0A2U9CV18_SCOMX|nr:putative nuclear factor erythroid 2-related factor 1-like [Scophthalmus maximus]